VICGGVADDPARSCRILRFSSASTAGLGGGQRSSGGGDAVICGGASTPRASAGAASGGAIFAAVSVAGGGGAVESPRHATIHISPASARIRMSRTTSRQIASFVKPIRTETAWP
jgi:hypothetical protein